MVANNKKGVTTDAVTPGLLMVGTGRFELPTSTVSG